MGDSRVLVALCGVTFSGKSSLARDLARLLPAVIVSLDFINEERGLDGGQGIAVAEWAETNRLAGERVRDLLRSGSDVIVDDTTSMRFLRDGWRALAAEQGADAALVWVTIDPETQSERMLLNRWTESRPDVPEEVLQAHLAGFEFPEPDEHAIIVDGATLQRPGRAAEIANRIRSV